MVLAVALAMIEPGQIPEWRPGAVYWKPLADGREVTVYPLMFGEGKLCVGPLADPIGFDDGFVYAELQLAVEAAQEWNPEVDEIPIGWKAREPKPKTLALHDGAKSVAIHSEAIRPNSLLLLTPELQAACEITELRQMGHETKMVHINGPTEDGKFVQIEGVRERDHGSDMAIRIQSIRVMS